MLSPGSLQGLQLSPCGPSLLPLFLPLPIPHSVEGPWIMTAGGLKFSEGPGKPVVRPLPAYTTDAHFGTLLSLYTTDAHYWHIIKPVLGLI